MVELRARKRSCTLVGTRSELNLNESGEMRGKGGGKIVTEGFSKFGKFQADSEESAFTKKDPVL